MRLPNDLGTLLGALRQVTDENSSTLAAKLPLAIPLEDIITELRFGAFAHDGGYTGRYSLSASNGNTDMRRVFQQGSR